MFGAQGRDFAPFFYIWSKLEDFLRLGHLELGPFDAIFSSQFEILEKRLEKNFVKIDWNENCNATLKKPLIT